MALALEGTIICYIRAATPLPSLNPSVLPGLSFITAVLDTLRVLLIPSIPPSVWLVVALVHYSRHYSI